MEKKHGCSCGCGPVEESLVRRNLALSETAAYQKGAIVSREVLKSKTGTVTVFAFDKGQGLSEHTAPFNAMVCVLDGEAEIRLSGELFRVGKGGMLIMPAGEPHALHAELLRDRRQLKIDDLPNLVIAQLPEQDDLVEPVQELRREVRAHVGHHARLDARVVRIPFDEPTASEV